MKRVERAQGEIPDDLPDAVFNERRFRSVSMVTRIDPAATGLKSPLSNKAPLNDDIIEEEFQPRVRSVTFATYDDKPRTVSIEQHAVLRQTAESLSNLSRPRAFSTFKRVILLAVDDSPNAKWAFNWYVEQINRQDDLLVIVHCPEYVGSSIFSPKTKFFMPAHKWQGSLNEANNKIKALEVDFESMCVQRKIKYHMRFEAQENSGQGILKIGDQEGADLIIMGSRGLSSLKKTFVNSVSDYVLRNSKVPVLVVPARSCRDPALNTK